MKKLSKKQIISEYMSELSKRGHKKNPISKEEMGRRGKLGALKRWSLSTEESLQ